MRGDFALDARMQRAARVAEKANVHSQHQWQHGRAFRIVQPGAECVIRLGISGGREAAVCVTPQNVLDDCARFTDQNREKKTSDGQTSDSGENTVGRRATALT